MSMKSNHMKSINLIVNYLTKINYIKRNYKKDQFRKMLRLHAFQIIVIIFSHIYIMHFFSQLNCMDTYEIKYLM